MYQSCQSGSDFSGRVRTWIFKNCRASIGPDAGAKSRFSVSNMAFAIDGIKRKKKTPCINIAVRNWRDCGWVKLVFFFY